MARISVYNKEGKEAGTMELNDVVFGVTPKDRVIHQVYVALQANMREPWAHTKDRGEVRGGGKKPWKQKGTGRARHGSIRSPIWRGGGITFGPRNVRNFFQKINRKMNQTAVRMCLSGKVREEKLLVLESLESGGKTKLFADLRGALPGAGKSTLLLVAEGTDALNRATRNIPTVHMQRAIDVNVADLLEHQYVLTTKDGIAALESRLA